MPSDPLDGEGLVDPFKVRAIEAWIDSERPKAPRKMDWDALREALEEIPRWPREDADSALMVGLAAILSEFAKGRARDKDAHGYCVIGDLANEVADQLIEFVNRVEGNNAAR